MKTEFKKFLCELAGVKYEQCKYPHSLCYDCNICEADEGMTKVTLEILIKAMFAINRDIEKGYFVTFVNGECVAIYRNTCGMNFMKKLFPFSDHNNSEQEALTAALQYIFDNKKEG